MLCTWALLAGGTARQRIYMEKASAVEQSGAPKHKIAESGPAGRSVTGRLFSWGKGGLLWRFLHFVKYGVSFRLGLKRTIHDPSDIKRINLLAVEHCTNSCKHCSTSSPFAAKRSHSASAFFPWLDRVIQGGIKFSQIAITGGEPFLHPDLGDFIKQLKERYPSKELGVTTNFFWANEQKNGKLAPGLRQLDRILISKYPNIVARLGGDQGFETLVDLLRKSCPQVDIAVSDGSHMIAWKLDAQQQTPKAHRCTSDCHVLRADGKISRCAVGVGLENRPEYALIVASSKERLYDLTQGLESLLVWAKKYPFDLCAHCSLWRGVQVLWRPDTGLR